MNRILLADDSPHAQRMGERILRDEGFEIVSVTDGETALLRMADVDPDVILADAFLPGRSGLDICRFIKKNARHRHVRLIVSAGMLEALDEAEARAAGADAIIRKPFESTVLLEIVKPLAADAERARSQPDSTAPPLEQALPVPQTPVTVGAGLSVSEEELVRAAITVALDAAFPALVEEITANVLRNLKTNTPDPILTTNA